ncbi:MAG: patatin family protein [Erysipelotrichaceae bacterium]|nr:patatin family protein [Erysipelotrichaceae bacterium]
MSKIGLVFEGGGLRGVFSAGVCDCFIDNDVKADYVIGVSAGSCNLYQYVAKARGYIRRCMIQKNPFNSFYGVPQMVTSHKFIDLDKIFDEYTYENGFSYDDFLANKDTKWEVVISNIETGKAEYVTADDIERAKLIGEASCSMPGLTPPIEIDNNYYLDGGICDSIPIQRALDQGCDKLIIVMTRKKGNFSAFNEPTKVIFRRIFGERPNFLKALFDRNELYRSQVALAERLEEEGKAIIIRPTMQEVGRLESDEDQLTLAYYHGYTKAKEYLDKIDSWK